MSKKDNRVKVRVIILDEQKSSRCYSIRLNEKQQAIKQINEFLKREL